MEDLIYETEPIVQLIEKLRPPEPMPDFPEELEELPLHD